MAIVDPTKPDDLVDLSQYAKDVGLSKQTIYRWRKFGLRGHKLHSLVIGGKLKTSKAALAEFIAATQPSAASEGAAQ